MPNTLSGTFGTMKIHLSATLLTACAAALVLVTGGRPTRVAAAPKPKKIPVILDTDIGDDIDDTWALGLILRSPELDLKLAVSDDGKPFYRSRILARFLQTAGRTDVPVGLGKETQKRGEGGQAAWVRDYSLNHYPGRVYADGVQALIDTIMASREPITIIAIGPAPNLAAALQKEPRIAEHARVAGMYGSVRVGYGGSKTPSAEYNVKQDVAACQKVFTAPWEMTITPLDTCGTIDLQGERYQRVRGSKDPVAAAVIENYRLWTAAGLKPGQADPSEIHSSTLFDTVAVELALGGDLVKLERLPIVVTDDGVTAIRPSAKMMNVATEWKSQDSFRDLLVERLTRGHAR